MINSRAAYRTVPLPVLLVCIAACASNSPQHGTRADLTILSLNLHTYQEVRVAGTAEAKLTSDQARQRVKAYGPIFDRIAAGIDALDPDLICFQEVGEWPTEKVSDPASVEFGASDSNMVHQILSRLDKRYVYTMDWSHYGWDVWLEGSAILSKYPLRAIGSRFISNPAHGRHEFWKSRNVPMAKLQVPRIGGVMVFSVHTGWWDDAEEPFQEQYERLLTWAAEIADPKTVTILCGDFNVDASGPGYEFMTRDTGYSDQYLAANPDGMLDATISGGAAGWEDASAGRRIDYILMNDDSRLVVTSARRVFTDEEFGRVSDHVGVYAEFSLK